MQVIILEKFDESLLLLRHKLCWSLRDILYFKLQVTPPHSKRKVETERTPEIISKHKEWSPVDYALYEHFTNKLDEEIANHGKDFQAELTHFQDVRMKFANFCLESCDTFDKIRANDMPAVKAQILLAESLVIMSSPWEPEFSLTRQDCVNILAQPMYWKAIKYAQWPQMCETKTMGYCNTSDLVGPFPLENLKSSTIFNAKKCRHYIDVNR